MDDPDEYALVMKALMEGPGNCVYWDDRSAIRVRSNSDLKGFTPEFIRRELIRLVRKGEVTVKQVVEQRPNWKNDYKYWYKAILPIEEFNRGLFVEMRVVDSSEPEEFPEVMLVNAHP